MLTEKQKSFVDGACPSCFELKEFETISETGEKVCSGCSVVWDPESPSKFEKFYRSSKEPSVD